MTTETDLLPLPAYDIDTVNHASVRLRGYTGDRTRTYARACVSSATEALRAEVARLAEVHAGYAAQAFTLTNRAERLAEALRGGAQELRNHAENEYQMRFEDNSPSGRKARLLHLADRIEARAALDQETTNG